MSATPEITDFNYDNELDNYSPLCFKAIIENSQVWLSATTEDTLHEDGSENELQLEYSIDNEQTWQDYKWNKTYGKVITLKAPQDDETTFSNDTVYFRAKNHNATFSKSDTQYIQFRVIGRFEVTGNIQTLLDRNGNSTVAPQYCYYKLFQHCHITTAPQLPATELHDCCYAYMFNDCTCLKATPVLPATTLAPFCYMDMFSSCIAITEVPKLDATQIAEGCYARMFKDCISLLLATTVTGQIALLQKTHVNDFILQMEEITKVLTTPEIPIITHQTEDIFTKFNEIVSTFPITIPFDVNMPPTTFDELLYAMNFYVIQKNKELSFSLNLTNEEHSTSLRLPAIYLYQDCYLSMFSGCKSITTIPVLTNNPDIKIDCYIFANGTLYARMPAFDYIRTLEFDRPSTATTEYEYSWFNYLDPENPVYRKFSEFARTGMNSNTTYYCWSDEQNNHIYTYVDSDNITEETTLYDNYKNEQALPYNIEKIVYNSNCYTDMFTDCINLNNVKLPFMAAMPEINLASYGAWMNNVSPTGAIWLPSNSKANVLIPPGWERLDLITETEVVSETDIEQEEAEQETEVES